MKIKTLIAYFIFTCAISSCIQDEALNSEAAIDVCSGDDVQLANIDADSKVINVYVNKGADLSKQKLKFTLPQGATIKVNTPIAGDTESTYDFSEEPHSRKFTVTSEDGQWQPVYTVNVILAELPTLFSFEELLTTSSEYDTFYEFTPATSQEISKVLQWSSGNPGFKLTGMANSRIDYPTVQVANGFKGKAVKLETRNTGDFGAMVKMYIAAGNLFIGTFEVENALTNPRKATNFGFQFYKHPIALKGHYKFKAGEVYSVEGQPQTGKRDKCDIYAVMYEAENNSIMLNGDDVFNSDKLVLLARIKPEDIIESEDEWNEFTIYFESVKGREIDDTKLQNGKYKLGIVLSSSVDGAYFRGAVGSTLYVDELELICKE